MENGAVAFVRNSEQSTREIQIRTEELHSLACFFSLLVQKFWVNNVRRTLLVDPQALQSNRVHRSVI